MTDAFTAMGYPHWLTVAGAIVVVLGFIRLAFRQIKGAEVKLTEMANENEQGRSEIDTNLAQTRARKAKRAEQTRSRGLNKDRVKEEPLNDRPKLSDPLRMPSNGFDEELKLGSVVLPWRAQIENRPGTTACSALQGPPRARGPSKPDSK